MRSARAVTLALVLGACAGLGPTSDPSWREHVARACPSEDGPVVFASAAEWLPDQQGFVSAFGTYPNVRQGAVALTRDSLIFVQWNREDGSYAILYRAANEEISQVRIAKFGRNRRLVLHGRDYRVQSFGISGPQGAFVDRGATEELYELLRARIDSRSAPTTR